jgi:hypothetical protein
MNLKEWIETFKPINVRQMYETYGKDLDLLRSQPIENIWTYCIAGDEAYIISGYHIVNRIGYYITEKPYPPDEYIVVDVDYGEEWSTLEEV